MPLPRSAERERGRRRRRDATIARLRSELADRRADSPAPPDPADEEERDPADLIAEWCADTLVVPTGVLQGQPFHLEDWQIAWLRDALAPGVREAALCCARKNGKSGLVAALLLAHLVGPLNRHRWRSIVVSLTGTLAKELRRQIVEIAQDSGVDHLLRDYATPVPGRIVGLQGAEVTVLAADKATGHSVGVDLAIVDESGLLEEGQRPLWDAVTSSTSGRPGGRTLHISIMGDGPMYGELKDRQDGERVIWHEYSADPDCDLLDVTAWRQANPGLGTIKDPEYMEHAAARAATTPAAAPGFRAYDLNIPGSAKAQMVVMIPDYLACVVDILPPREGPAVLALDLGGASAFTAAACYWRSGRCEVYAGIGGIPDLGARGQGDGVGGLYQRMHDAQELWLYEGQRETPIGDFVRDLAARLEGENIVRLVADEYRGARLLDALDEAELWNWARRLETRPVRWKQANEDIVAFQGAVIGGRVSFQENTILTSAIREAKLESDTNGNVRLSKRRHLARIDPLTAVVLAVAEGSRLREPRPIRYSGMIG